jgi:hypothetical protein
VWKIISLVSRWPPFFDCLYFIGSGEGQLAVVPPAVATTVPGAKGSALSAGGEISALTVVTDEAGVVSHRLREPSQRLSQVVGLDFGFYRFHWDCGLMFVL